MIAALLLVVRSSDTLQHNRSVIMMGNSGFVVGRERIPRRRGTIGGMQGELKLAEGEVHVHLDHHEVINWPCPECGADCRPMIISRSGSGVIWTPANMKTRMRIRSNPSPKNSR